MNLYLHESILLLGLDDEKGSFSIDSTYLYYGFAAALIMDLVLAERITVEDGRIVVKTNALTDRKALNEVLRRLQDSRKKRKVTHWIHYLVQRISTFRSLTVEQLIRGGILERQQKKVLWVFNVNRYPSADTGPENQLKARLLEILFDDKSPEPRERMLLSIIQACKVDKEIIADKKQRKKAAERIRMLTSDDEMRKYVDDAIQEMQVAIMVSTTAAIS